MVLTKFSPKCNPPTVMSESGTRIEYARKHAAPQRMLQKQRIRISVSAIPARDTII
jgi:hypothetical protein